MGDRFHYAAKPKPKGNVGNTHTVSAPRTMFSKALRTAVNSLPPTEKKKAKERKHLTGGHIKTDDETVLSLIRRVVVDGESIGRVAEDADVDEATLRQWVVGQNRSHLRLAIDREMMKRSPRHG
jgi:hypothetical protein